jgi:hypothetical protein
MRRTATPRLTAVLAFSAIANAFHIVMAVVRSSTTVVNIVRTRTGICSSVMFTDAQYPSSAFVTPG